MGKQSKKEKRKEKWNYDHNRVRRLLALFGYDYTKKEMKLMKKLNTPLYSKVVESINQFGGQFSFVTPVWRIFLIEKSQTERKTNINVKPLYSDSSIKFVEEQTISRDMIEKLSLQFLPSSMKEMDNRQKLYHLISSNHIRCLKNRKIYKYDKSLNSCVIMDHDTEFAQFIRDDNGIERMSKKLSNSIVFNGNIRKLSKKDAISYGMKRIENLYKEITELIKNENKFIKEAKKSKKVKKLAVVVEEEEKISHHHNNNNNEPLVEIDVTEAAIILDKILNPSFV